MLRLVNTPHLVAILMLALIGRARAFVTIVVELDPHFTSTAPPICSAPFIKNFESNLTAWVLNATQAMSFLSDFTIPGGFHLTYQNAAVRRLEQRSLRISPTCHQCTSAGCAVSCGIGVCRLCGSSRRQMKAVETLQDEDSNETQLDNRRIASADWSTVGTDVTNSIQPLITYYASIYAGGCLGDSNLLGVNVTYESNVPIDATMSDVIIAAFGVAATAPPPNTPQACCSMDFTSCVNYCGTTQQQCQTCGAVDVGWIPKGPPAQGSCTARWNGCTTNVKSCCPGLQCIGDQYWKGCFYVPQHYASPTAPVGPSSASPVSTPTVQAVPPTRLPSTISPTRSPSLRPTSRPVTSGGWSWWHL